MKKPSPFPPLSSMVKPFFTVDEVGEVLRVGRMVVYNLIHDGYLPAVKVGRAWRVTDVGLQAYIEGATTRTSPPPPLPPDTPPDTILDEAPEDWSDEDPTP